MALGDVFDALTSRRVYKEAFTFSTARSIIVQHRGKRFDPDTVDGFLAGEAVFYEIRQNYSSEAAQPTELTYAG